MRLFQDFGFYMQELVARRRQALIYASLDQEQECRTAFEQLAQDNFDGALALDARLGAHPWLAHTKHHYVAMLGARGQPGDGERARSFISEAEETGKAWGEEIVPSGEANALRPERYLLLFQERRTFCAVLHPT